MENCKELNSCLCCTGENLRTILDLGAQSPANNYNVKEKFPLRLNVCLDCSHAQLSHSVNPDILFKDYPYMSGVSQTMKEYYEWFVHEIKARSRGKNVLEIACNDGSQLDAFKKYGFNTYGVEPAKNIADIAAKNHVIFNKYFEDFEWNADGFDILIAQNVLAHVPDPYYFLQKAKKVMHRDSILCIQTSQAKMLENYQFDTIYHEHISFFNKRSFSQLINRAGFEIIEHQFLPEIHGGSDLYILKKLPEISIQDYSDFQNRSYKFAAEFREKVEEIQKTGSKVICYGAAAKMVNLIRFTGIKPNYLIDDTPTKLGKTICDITCAESAEVLPYASNRNREAHIIPVWNFYGEIKSKVEKQYPGKFKFIKYIPEIVIE